MLCFTMSAKSLLKSNRILLPWKHHTKSFSDFSIFTSAIIFVPWISCFKLPISDKITFNCKLKSPVFCYLLLSNCPLYYCLPLSHYKRKVTPSRPNNLFKSKRVNYRTVQNGKMNYCKFPRARINEIAPHRAHFVQPRENKVSAYL